MDSALLTSIRLQPIEESELKRLNEMSNMPEIAEQFETIPPVSMETTRIFWNYIRQGFVSLWGIHVGDLIIGGAGFSSQPRGTRISHIVTFFVYLIPDYWGQGIGTHAIRFLEDQARIRKYVKMECLVAETNPRAMKLYERLGYEHEGKRRKAYWIDGTYVDLYLLGKIL